MSYSLTDEGLAEVVQEGSALSIPERIILLLVYEGGDIEEEDIEERYNLLLDQNFGNYSLALDALKARIKAVSGGGLLN